LSVCLSAAELLTKLHIHRRNGQYTVTEKTSDQLLATKRNIPTAIDGSLVVCLNVITNLLVNLKAKELF